MSNINVPSKFVDILGNVKSFKSPLSRSVDLNIICSCEKLDTGFFLLWETWILNRAGREQRAHLDVGLNTCLEMAALKQLQKEAGKARGQRRELDPPCPCLSFLLKSFLVPVNSPFPSLHTTVYCILHFLCTLICIISCFRFLNDPEKLRQTHLGIVMEV